MTTTLVFATRNAGKLRELERLVGDLPFRFRPLSDFPGAPDVEETGSTFVENAALKALSAWQYTGLPALADDSGLCVNALGGAPGVQSARFAGVDGDAARNNEKLLRELRHFADPATRRAWFQATLALVGPRALVSDAVPAGAERPSFLPSDVALRVLEGRVDGSILHDPRGSGGFGYDPLFWSDEAGMSFAELPLEQKNRISHRGRAFEALRAYLEGLSVG